jgi:hypothetical protein
MAAGWTGVYGAATLASGSSVFLAGAGTALVNPVTAAFLGSYFFSAWFLFGRYIGGDLGPPALLHVAVRTWLVVLLTLALEQVWLGADSALVVAAFVAGIIPSVAYQVVVDAGRSALGRIAKGGATSGRLTELEGMDLFKEARFVEEGIDNIHNLAMDDPTRLVVVTREGWLRILDWTDQAILRTAAADEWKTLRGIGIRTATGLESAAFDAQEADSPEEMSAMVGHLDFVTFRNIAVSIQNHPNFQRIKMMRASAERAAKDAAISPDQNTGG